MGCGARPRNFEVKRAGYDNFPEVCMSTTTLPDDPLLRERFSELKPPLAPQAAVIEADRLSLIHI